jgi:hypothetical protein
VSRPYLSLSPSLVGFISVNLWQVLAETAGLACPSHALTGGCCACRTATEDSCR